MNFKLLSATALTLAVLAPAPAEAFFWRSKKKIDLNKEVTSIQNQVLSLDCEERSIACNERKIQGLQKVSKSVNKTLGNAEVEILNVRVNRISRNENGTYKVFGSIVTDKTQENTRVGRSIAAWSFLVSPKMAKEVWTSTDEMQKKGPEYVAYDPSFTKAQYTIKITVDQVSFRDLTNVEKNGVITLKNITGFGKTTKSLRCGILDFSCSSFSGSSVSLYAKKASGAGQ